MGSRDIKLCKQLILLLLAAGVTSCGGSPKGVGMQDDVSKSNAVAKEGGARVLFINPDNQQVLAAEVSSKLAENIRLAVQLEGVDAQRFSIGYRLRQGLNGIQVQGNNVFIPSPGAGSYQLQIVARDVEGCMRLGQPDCRIDGRGVEESRSYDLVGSLLINVIDPYRQVSTGKSTGGGIIGQVIRGDGLIGTLAKVFMGGDGLGGMLGGGNQTPQPQPQTPQTP